MSQSKRHSALETATNTAVGFVGSYFITFGCFHLNADLATKTLYATLGCTVWSLLRGYYLRRLFNHLHTKAAREPWAGLDDLESKTRDPDPADSALKRPRLPLHQFIQTGDADSFKAIEDGNGEVVLAYCRVCKCAEGELPTQCPGTEATHEAREAIYAGTLDFKFGAWRHAPTVKAQTQ